MSSRTSGRRVEARTFAPSPGLRGLVEGYWTTRWDLRGQAPHVAELLADPCVNICFERGASRVVGVWTKLWRRTLEGQGSIRAVKLRAGAVRRLVATPACGLTDRIVSLASVIPCDVRRLERAILGPTDDREAFARVEAWLGDRVRDEATADVDLAIALVERIAADRSITTVDALVVHAGVGKRGLQRLFREFVGAPPKSIIRRFRLQEAALRLEAGDSTGLAGLAAELGYADQAHFARDFKHATGRTPTEFVHTVG